MDSVKEDSAKQGNGIQDTSLNLQGMETLAGHSPAGARKWKVIVEGAGVGVFMVIVWMLLLLPIIFYHLPVNVEIVPPRIAQNDTIKSSNADCLQAFEYPAEANNDCRVALQGILSSKMNCDSRGAPLVLHHGDTIATLLQIGLNRLPVPPSKECREAVVPLLCQHFFGLCDSSGVSIQPTSGQCEHLRDNLCVNEWKFAESAGIDLPVCENLPREQASCPDQSGSGTINASVDQNTPQELLLPCREGFFREEMDILCSPRCGEWKEFSPAEVISTDVVIILSAVIGFLAGLAVVVISLMRFKRMFVFPSTFVIYLTCDLMVAEFFIIINYFDRPALYCTSPNLIRSIYEVAPFCVISGMVFVYALVQTAIWWLFHTTALFWKIRYPFHARSFQMSYKFKYLHVSCIIAGLLIPLLPIVASMISFAVELKSNTVLQNMNITFLSGGLGFRQVRFPPILCSGRNSDIIYYTSIFLINIIVIVGLTELILLFWTIHRQHGLFKVKQSKNPLKIGTPEKKILVTLSYYVVMAAFALSRYTVIVRNAEPYEKQLVAYFACEADPNNFCDRNSFRKLTYPFLSAISLVLIGLFPAVNLVYALNVKDLKDKYRGRLSLLRKQSESTITSSKAKT